MNHFWFRVEPLLVPYNTPTTQRVLYGTKNNPFVIDFSMSVGMWTTIEYVGPLLPIPLLFSWIDPVLFFIDGMVAQFFSGW